MSPTCKAALAPDRQAPNIYLLVLSWKRMSTTAKRFSFRLSLEPSLLQTCPSDLSFSKPLLTPAVPILGLLRLALHVSIRQTTALSHRQNAISGPQDILQTVHLSRYLM